MRWIFLGLSFISSCVMAQNITRLEYFFDTDPGFGNGINVPITPSADITKNFTIDLSGLSTGAHMLVVRGKDANARWSLLNSKSVFVQNKVQGGPLPDIMRLEYFFDSDPGIGNATPISLASSPNVSQNALLDLSSITPGFHMLVVRARNDIGGWSMGSSKPFFAANTGTNIVAVEYYYFDGSVKTTPRSYTNFTPGQNVTIDFNAILVGLLTNTSYEIHITAINAAGQRSVEAVKVFTTPTDICNITPPTANNASRCDNGTITLSASGASAAPATYNWFDTVTGGTLLTSGPLYEPNLSTSQTFYVNIVDGLGICESARTAVVATVGVTPFPPTTSGATTCVPAAVTLTASGGSNGDYRWYTTPTGGTAIINETNSTYLTPVINATTTFYVAIKNGFCESGRTPAVAGFCNRPPTITPVPINTVIGGITTVDLSNLINDLDNNVDLSTLKITQPPPSGATASIDANLRLTLNYEGIDFAGKEELTVEVCDSASVCIQQVFQVQVDGDIIIYTGISPNGDTKNDYWVIQYIDLLEDTRANRVTVFNRWGDPVFETENYDNVSRVFKGLNKSGGELPTGTYFYRIEFTSGRKIQTGYLSLKR